MWLSYAFGITFFAYFIAMNSKNRWYLISIRSSKPEFDNMIIDCRVGLLMKATYRIIENNDYQGTYL